MKEYHGYILHNGQQLRGTFAAGDHVRPLLDEVSLFENGIIKNTNNYVCMACSLFRYPLRCLLQLLTVQVFFPVRYLFCVKHLAARSSFVRI